MSKVLSIKLLEIYYSKRFLTAFFCMVVVISYFHFYAFVNSGIEQSSVYDLLLYTYNDFFYVNFLISMMSLIFIIPLLSQSSFLPYVITKFSSRKSWYNHVLISAALLTVLFIGALFLLCILQAIPSSSFVNEWTVFSSQVLNFPGEQGYNASPLLIVCYSVLLCFFYCLTLNIYFFVIHLFLKNIVLSLGIGLLLNAISTAIFLSRMEVFYAISFSGNFLVQQINSEMHARFLQSIFYWVVQLLILFLIGWWRANRMSLIGEQK